MADLAVLGLILSSISAAVGVAGAITAGNTAKAAADYEAQQFKIAANEKRAIAQRKAEEDTRDKELVLSRQRSTAASSGLGALDESVLQLMGDVEEQGTLNKMTSLALGENAARGLEDAGTLRRFEGRAAKRAGLYKAAGIALNAGSGFFNKYGDGGFGADNGVEGYEGGGNYG